MYVQAIQNNNNYDTSFGARLKLTGQINDISKETMNLWKTKAKSIGTDRDLITLHFGTFMTERGSDYKMGKFYNWIANIRASLCFRRKFKIYVRISNKLSDDLLR